MNRRGKWRGERPLVPLSMGAVIALVPMIGLPASAILKAVRRRAPGISRGEAFAFACLCMLGGIEIAHGGAPVVAGTFAVAAGLRWILSAEADGDRERNVVARGIAGGLALSAIFAIGQYLDQGTRVSGPAWFPHPNLFAHSVLAVTALGTLRSGSRTTRGAVLLAALPSIVLSGSRTALAGWLLITLIALPGRARRWALVALVPVAILAFTLSPRASGFVPALHAMITGDLAPLPNVLIDTESLDGDLWRAVGVEVEPVWGAEPDGTPTTWRVQREGGGRQSGPRQRLVIAPERTYTFTAEMLREDGSIPGLLLVRRSGSETTHLFEVLLGDGRPRVRSRGGLKLVAARQRELDDGWQRLEASFRYDGERGELLEVGFMVDGAETASAASYVRALQLREEGTPGGYADVSREQRRSWTSARTALARGTIWRIAASGVGDRPVFGHGAPSFEEWYLQNAPADEPNRQPPAHAHSLPLHLAFSYGLVGFGAAAGMFAYLAFPALRYRDRPVLAAGVVFLLMNLTDATLTYSGVAYPLAALFATSARGSNRASWTVRGGVRG